MHRLDLGLYSHPKEFWGGMEFEPMLTPSEKSPLPKKSPEEDRTRDAVDSEPKDYQLSYSGHLFNTFQSEHFLLSLPVE